MGKKVRAKARNPRKVHSRPPAGSIHPVSETGDPKEVSGDDESSEPCSHYSKSSDELGRVLLGILQSNGDAVACEHCREQLSSKRGGKEKGKQQRKKEGAKHSEPKSESNVIWVCLDCNRFFCGGAVNDSEPYGHARRHSKQERHSWAARFDNPSIGWCYTCNSNVQLDLPDEAADGEEVKSTKDDKGVENGFEPLTNAGTKGYMVRGLSNLGNTCFFNSVMQNLLSIDMMREYMVNLDKTIGPLTMALKKLFAETSAGTDTRGVLSPKNLFGCICSKATQFRGYQQQDSHELLRYLLDGLHVEETCARKSEGSYDEQEKATSGSGSTIVETMFGGQLSSTVCCVECGHTSIVHEPFLDLSLPVPSKKPPPKKVPPPPPKRSKPPSKERNKSRRFQEKGNSKESLVQEQHTAEESGTSVLKCCQSSLHVPVPKSEENFNFIVEEASEDNKLDVPALKQENVPEATDFWWMDYLGEPSAVMDDLIVDTHDYNHLDVQYSDNGQICESENNLQFSADSQIDNETKQLIVSSDYGGENNVEFSCIQDSGVILLPYEEIKPTKQVSDATSWCANPEDVSSTNDPLRELNVQETSFVLSEQPEADFDGLGDLFNEPDVTSELKTETGTTEEMDVPFWASNSSESNQEELDNTNAPVSINSCLALYTKPELLTDEHAWYCEHCSEVLSQHLNGNSKGENEAVAKIDYSEQTNPEDVDGCQVRNEKVLLNFQVGCLNTIENMAVSNAEAASASSHMDSNEEAPDASKELLNVVKYIRSEDGETTISCKLRLPGTVLYGQDCSTYITAEDQVLVNSGPRITAAQETMGVKGGISYKEEIGLGGQAHTASCRALQSHSETVLSNSSSSDNVEVNHTRKKGKKLLGQLHQVKGSGVKVEEPERKKVKRDATKRILINRAPLVLTIHLKRFSQDARGRLTKLNGHICFQEILDLRPYLDPRCEEKGKCTYHLVGVVEHSGSMSNGHYVAYVRGEWDRSKRTPKDGNLPSWFYASDAHVRAASLSEVLQSEAYILFYERV